MNAPFVGSAGLASDRSYDRVLHFKKNHLTMISGNKKEWETQKSYADRSNTMKSGNMNMVATHSVKDEDDKSIGFMVNGQFISNETIKAGIYEIDNLAVQENGEIM